MEKKDEKKKELIEKTKKIGCSCGGDGFSISIIRPKTRKSDDKNE